MDLKGRCHLITHAKDPCSAAVHHIVLSVNTVQVAFCDKHVALTATVLSLLRCNDYNRGLLFIKKSFMNYNDSIVCAIFCEEFIYYIVEGSYK